MAARVLPECWGHRGASAAFPENTLASFEAAMRDGAEGIESDVHVSLDDIVLMFHDPSLGRTTDGRGLIREKRWSGDMEHVRTVREPKQAIPTFAQTIELLMRPENRHVTFNTDRSTPLAAKVESRPPGGAFLFFYPLPVALWPLRKTLCCSGA
ncbi:Phosphatidylglycerol phospholipase C OS=Schizosaccharomyces pombe (strain 972 / ATCC 24843) GN=SPAC4D7,02c PE=3 SV=2 [Rhizoctonia solani AG-1 IB]|uniref:Phosphatidylglycerol phospholipase C n=1 Tax=Thanatephorus cucumeris (strain AG1-IB / isolate 7/3/14) TaxID=1108050 RepID=A0A0B7FQT2_THACB|nr:Phosphatidylglycerol phospholipase C OS=Schizosaccharomyces pombe (strain 972 / ATCC 24843) GN=SPAC4D7,02c PE=3 SV=2 [Rhizoctonia solani AG-1 IB]